jgi:hypothetical protein
MTIVHGKQVDFTASGRAEAVRATTLLSTEPLALLRSVVLDQRQVEFHVVAPIKSTE